MPWSGASGSETFSRTDGTRTGSTTWQQAKAANVKVVANDHDTHDQDISDGINACLKKDGGNTPTSDIPMGGYKFTGVDDATARDQFAAVGQVQDGSFIWCGTAGGTANALTLTPTPAITAYASGQSFVFEAATASSSTVTVAVSGLAAKAVEANGTALSSTVTLQAGKHYRVRFDGTAMRVTRESDVITYGEGLANTGGELTADITGLSSATPATGDSIMFSDADDSDALKKATLSGLLSLGLQLKTGGYTGDGSTSQAVTGVGFQPKFLFVWESQADGGSPQWGFTSDSYMSNDPQGLMVSVSAAGAATSRDNIVLSLDSDGFTVSDDSADRFPNSIGVAYQYIALG
jgi:hypothetical protein